MNKSLLKNHEIWSDCPLKTFFKTGNRTFKDFQLFMYPIYNQIFLSTRCWLIKLLLSYLFQLEGRCTSDGGCWWWLRLGDDAGVRGMMTRGCSRYGDWASWSGCLRTVEGGFVHRHWQQRPRSSGGNYAAGLMAFDSYSCLWRPHVVADLKYCINPIYISSFYILNFFCILVHWHEVHSNKFLELQSPY